MKNYRALGLFFLTSTAEIKPGIILLVSALFITIHRYISPFEFNLNLFSIVIEFNSALNMFLTAFLLLGIIPLIIMKIGFNEQLAEYGITPGNVKTGFFLIAILYPLISILLLFPSSNTKEMIAFYPLDKEATTSIKAFVEYELLRAILFYTAWEFFFRGFMLFGLKKYVGNWLAICIQTIPSCLWHIGMPAGEIFASIFGGIMFGLIALKTKSIFYPLILHILIGLTLDLLIILQN